MFFDTTRLPANHNTPEWHSKLKNSIIGYINQVCSLSGEGSLVL